MRRAGALLIEGFFRGFSRVARLHPQARPHRHGVEHIKDVRYAPETDTEAHLLDIYRPDAKASATDRHRGPPWPIVFYVHGGGFSLLSKDTHWVMGLGFARRGYLVINVSYRLAPRHRFPAALEDVCQAYLWMVENAASYGGDLGRVVLAGESAGANLVTSLAIALSYDRPEPFAKQVFATGVVPRAVVPACGVFQVSDLARLKRRKPHLPSFIANRLLDIERGYLGPGPWPDPAALDLADPVVFLERGDTPARPLPAFFLPVGTKDPLLPDTRRLAIALRALGGEAIARFYPGELHAFHAFVMRDVARSCWRDTYSFLERYIPTR